MNLTCFKLFFCRNDVKIVIFCTLTGGILQVISKRYLKNHPEFLKDATNKSNKRPRFISPSGGAFIAISGISIETLAKLVRQQKLWSNTTYTGGLGNLNPKALLPRSPNNTLGLVDIFDVPVTEKAFMESSVLKGAKNSTHIIFLNNN